MPPRRPLPQVATDVMSPPPAAVSNAVGFLVNEVAALFRQRFEEVLAAHRLRRRQYLMLLVLRDEGPMPQQALGQRLAMDRTTTMQLVQNLADAGSVNRHDDPSDRRVYVLSLTASGRRLVATLEGLIKRAESELLAPLTADARKTFATQLRAVLAAKAVADRAS